MSKDNKDIKENKIPPIGGTTGVVIQTALLPTEQPTVKAPKQPAVKAKKQPANPNHQPMFDALAEICELDVGLNRGQLGQTAKALLKSGYDPPAVRTFRDWWDANDWRGKAGSPPTLAQVRQCIKQSEGSNSPAKMAGPGLVTGGVVDFVLIDYREGENYEGDQE